MIEVPAESLIEIWEMVSDGLSSSKKNDMAVRFIKVFVDHEVELSDLSDLKGEDEHLDYAFEHFEKYEDYEDIEEQDGYED